MERIWQQTLTNFEKQTDKQTSEEFIAATVQAGGVEQRDVAVVSSFTKKGPGNKFRHWTLIIQTDCLLDALTISIIPLHHSAQVHLEI